MSKDPSEVILLCSFDGQETSVISVCLFCIFAEIDHLFLRFIKTIESSK